MWPIKWDEIQLSIESALHGMLPLPQWIEHAGLAFVIICSAMLFRRSAVCRLAFAVVLLASGAMLLELVPQPTLANGFAAGLTGGFTGPFQTASLQHLMADKRQLAEIALLSLGSAWILDECRALLARRRLARATAGTKR
jgi:hypothetical protein